MAFRSVTDGCLLQIIRENIKPDCMIDEDCYRSYSELNLNQYSVGSPCRTIRTVCGSPPWPDLNLIHYMMKRMHVHLAIVLHRNTAPLKNFVAAPITIRILPNGKTASTEL